jgi:small subunit ribosomal protein S20
VAHSLSSKKRVRQNVKRKAVNRMRVGKVKADVKNFEELAKARDISGAEKVLSGLVKKLDQTSATKSIHWRTAARKKSRLTKRLNAMKVKTA